MSFWYFLGFVFGGAGFAWAGEDEAFGFGMVSGLLLLAFLFSTAWAGFAMLKGKASRKRHHLLAYLTLALALIHAFYNIFLH